MKAKKYALTGTRKQRDGIFLLLSEFFDCFLSIFKPDNKKCHIFHLIHFDWNLFSQNALSSNLLTDILLFFKHPIKHQQNSASYIDDINDCISFWDVLKEDIKWKNRYQIDSNKILELHWDKLLCNNQRKIKSNSYLYRARLHSNENQHCYNTMEMGVPDKEKSKNGRGNPHGIPYLYLSTNKETTLHELRANYFDVASLGIFTINKNQNLNLVDFTPQTKHFIDTNNIVEYFKSYLLKKKIRYDFDKPLRHFDSIIEYYPTQFICEFIKVHCKGIDGILYPSSVYSKGRNIILFNNEKVSCIDVKECRVVDIKLKVEYY